MTQLTEKGFELTRLDERYDQLVAALKLIFGADINVDPNTPDGQTIAIFAESINNLEMLVEKVYQSFNPDTALGVSLSRLVLLNGISRSPGAFSSVSLLCTGTAGTLIPAGSLCRNADGTVVWRTVVDVTIDDNGQAVVQALATKMGALTADPDQITSIATPVYGWQTVTNPAKATPGQLEESDEHLRVRRAASTSTAAQSMLDSIYGTLMNQPGVLQAKVYENATDAEDGNGLPAHTIYAVVDGGDDQRIWDVLWFKKGAGVRLYGDTVGTVVDTMGNPHEIRFDRPQPQRIYVTVNLNKLAAYPTDGDDRIKDAIVAWVQDNQHIGDDLVQSQLFTPINSVPGVSVTSLLLGINPNPNSSANVDVPFNGIAAVAKADITVNAL